MTRTTSLGNALLLVGEVLIALSCAVVLARAGAVMFLRWPDYAVQVRARQIRVGAASTDVARRLGPPDMQFSRQDFGTRFPLSGYTWDGHEVRDTVWVYRCFNRLYVYFDKNNTVEHVGIGWRDAD